MEINDKNLIDIFKTLRENGASCYLVGGYVRDSLLGIENKDLDVEVFNISIEKLAKLTKGKINEKFGVVNLKEYNLDLTIPREEIKNGNSYTDFVINLNPNLDLKKAAKRRDFSINSIMYDIYNDKIIDNYKGIEDLKNKKIRHISEKFNEDPLRVLRAIRFSTNLNFEIDKKTYEICLEMIEDIKFLHINKKSSELNKILSSKKSNLVKQKKSLELLSLYIGEIDFEILERLCINKFNNHIELLKIIIFLKSSKIEEFIPSKKEILRLKKIIYLKDKVNNNLSNEDIYDIFIEIRTEYDIFLEVLFLFDTDESIINKFKKINDIYNKSNWSNLFKNNNEKNKTTLKKKYILLQIDK